MPHKKQAANKHQVGMFQPAPGTYHILNASGNNNGSQAVAVLNVKHKFGVHGSESQNYWDSLKANDPFPKFADFEQSHPNDLKSAVKSEFVKEKRKHMKNLEKQWLSKYERTHGHVRERKVTLGAGENDEKNKGEKEFGSLLSEAHLGLGDQLRVSDLSLKYM